MRDGFGGRTVLPDLDGLGVAQRPIAKLAASRAGTVARKHCLTVLGEWPPRSMMRAHVGHEPHGRAFDRFVEDEDFQ